MLPFHLYQSVNRALAEAVQKRKDKLAKGHWETEAEGKKLCGEIAGLQEAAQIVTDEMGKLENLEEEDADVA